MAPRPAWKGYLKLSLVACAVELTNATTYSEKVHFRMLNRKTGHTLKRQYIDSVTEKPVADEDEIKGYEIGDDEFVLVEEDEIDAVQIEASHTLSIDHFVEKSSIEQIYLDTPYYLTPADTVSEEAFAVIREAMARKKMAGLASIVLYRRERPVVIEPLGKGLLLTTLRYEKTVREPETVFDELRSVKIDSEMIELATHIIDKKKGKFDPSKFEDHYEDALLDLIRSKQKGGKAPKKQAPARPANVVNLFDALKKSLGEDKEPAAKTKAPKRGAGKTSAKTPAKRKSA